MKKWCKNITIRDIEKLEGIEYNGYDFESSLTVWYDKVRTKKLIELIDGDIARFIRQRIFLDYIVCEALDRIKLDPLIGEMFEGEVLINLAEIESDFWENNREVSNIAKTILGNIDIKKSESYEFLFEKDIIELREALLLFRSKVM